MGIFPRQLLNRYMLKKFSGKEWFGINEEASQAADVNNEGDEHHSDTNFVGSISPQGKWGVYKIMLTDSGHIVLVYRTQKWDGDTFIGHVHSHPDGEMIKIIKINPADIGE